MTYLKANWDRIIIDNLIWLILLLFTIVISLVEPKFFTVSNFTNILTNSVVLGVLVLGQAMVLMLGYFDLSSESVLGVAAVAGAWLMVSVSDGGSGWEISPWTAMPLMILMGMGFGLLNGTMITRFRMSPFIVTLAMLILLRGLSFAVSEGQTIAGLPSAFTFIGSASVFGFMPLAVFVVVALYLFWQSVLSLRPFGRKIYAVGGNPDAALASGVDPPRVIRRVYVISGGLAAFAGILMAGQLSSVTANAGQGLIFDVMAAAVIGGISLQGGRGSLAGAFGGVILLGFIGSALNLSDIPSFWIDVVKGLVILIAVFLDSQKDRLRTMAAVRRNSVGLAN